MQKQAVVMVTTVVLFFFALCAGIYYFMYYKKPVETANSQKKPSVDLTLENLPPAKENIPSSSDLRVQGVNTSTPQNSQNSNSSQLPLPEEFKAYEQYANSETAQFQEITKGTGLEASNGDTLAVTYKGWLTDGTLFDQNRVDDQGKAKPFIFVLGAHGVIPGWEQTILGMKEGGKRRLVIPAKLGYGENGQGPIPANSMLIFDVELVQVQKP